ncbi:DUF3618 domain-containing protein [Streptomyces sp. NPDC052077]|uniref:DUF3618 domain-containing protein n=1 Tax=Streptomyces sp. NPDC052077 TaxID=3154757 RepID=UPI00344AEFEE
MSDRTSRDRTGTGATAEHTGGAKGPDELRRQIERTRGELGDTVAELAGKVDVGRRARVRAAALRDRAGARAVQLRSTAAHAGHAARERAAGWRAAETGADGNGHGAGAGAEGVGTAPGDGPDVTGPGGTHRAPGRLRGVVDAGRGHPRVVLAAGAAGVAGAVVAVGVLRRGHRGSC